MKALLTQLVFTLIFSTSILAAPAGPTSLFDHLHKSQMAEVSLSIDLDEIISMKKSDAYLNATFGYGDQNWDVRVKTRGRYRRKVCDFPPLKLKFSKKGLTADGLGEHNDFKLVTHCSDDWNSREYVAREQLAYELYSLVSEKSLRTQLVKITYIDDVSGRSMTRYGILIEDIDEMAERFGAVELDDAYNLPTATFRDGSLERVAMFQYMIGNADYDHTMMRNVKYIQTPDGSNTVVPYDFDFSAIVNAPYAIPNVEIGQQRITDRVMRYDFSNDKFMRVAQEFKLKEDSILQSVADNPYVSKRTKNEIMDYLGLFFQEIDTALQTGTMPR